MPFGLSNAHSTFLRLLTEVLKKFMGMYAVYLMIFSKDKIQYLEHLGNVFKVLHDNRLLEARWDPHVGLVGSTWKDHGGTFFYI